VPAEAEPGDDLVDLNQASYEDLRGLGLSVTQAGRLLEHRERAGSFTAIDELDSIPGFPRSFLVELKRKVRV
jgi:DNA uptake protein ComE-like DNA-binding protein